MKKIYIVRHAKALNPESHQRDFDRELHPQGHRDAQTMATWFASTYSCPERWVSSSAPRAFSTAEHFAHAITPIPTIESEMRIYEAPYQDLLQVLQETTEQVNSVILFGHNPGVSYLVQALTKQYVDFSTGSIACLNTEMQSWKELDTASCSLLSMTKP